MASIIVLFERQEESRALRSFLARNGYDVAGACTSGAQALALSDRLGAGILICGYKYPDMTYEGLAEDLPRGFELLLLAQGSQLAEGVREGVVSLAMPLKTADLISTLDMMISEQARRRQRRRFTPARRSAEEAALVHEAKSVLMGRNHMTEPEAHRYLQKRSMDSGVTLVEAAQMILALLDR